MKKIIPVSFIFFYIFFINLNVASAEKPEYTSNSEIVINNNSPSTSSWGSTKGGTSFEAGLDIGGILNAHFFPGILDYARGNYMGSLKEMDYCLGRPEYIKVNPKGYKYLSYGHYIRGMIYSYHASGHKRYIRAKNDFEQAIRWDPGNHYAYLELARVHVAVGAKEQAMTVLQQLLELKPTEKIALQAQEELNLVNSSKKG